jgi:hypothetical protein
MRMMLRSRRAVLGRVLLFLGAGATAVSPFVPWLHTELYEITGSDGVFRWQSATDVSPLPWLLNGRQTPFVWASPPSPHVMEVMIFGPPAVAMILALSAWLSVWLPSAHTPQWLRPACLVTALGCLIMVAYFLLLFTDPFYHHESGVLDDLRTSAGPGLVLALSACSGIIVAGLMLPDTGDAASPAATDGEG